MITFTFGSLPNGYNPMTLFDQAFASVGMTPGTVTVTMRQYRLALRANGIIYTVSNAISADIADPVNIEWNSGATVTQNDAQSNIATTAADLSETAVEDLGIQIMNTLNSRGLKISNLPRTLLVPTALMFEANRVLKSILQSNTANNNINVIRAIGMFPDGIKVNHYFSSATAWFIRTNIPRGAMWMQREAISFDQDNDFDTKNAKAAVYERYSCGVTDWRQCWGNAGV